MSNAVALKKSASRFFDMNFVSKSMSIAILRCMATMLITNTHLDNAYPTDKLAVGGLIGDVLFFMISGYCIIDSRSKNFVQYYIKRFFRVYPAVLIMMLVNLSVGFFYSQTHLIGLTVLFIQPSLISQVLFFCFIFLFT